MNFIIVSFLLKAGAIPTHSLKDMLWPVLILWHFFSYMHLDHMDSDSPCAQVRLLYLRRASYKNWTIKNTKYYTLYRPEPTQ